MPTVYRGCAERPEQAPPTVLTIGNFDGVHLGHQALLRRAAAVGGGASLTVLTFDPPPRDVLRPDNGIPRIQPLSEKIRALGDAGAAEVVVERFDAALAALPAEDFARDRVGRLRPVAVVVGFDFRFGQRRLGTADTLRAALGVPVFVEAPVSDDQGPISSSRIREAIGAGDLVLAHRLLGRPHAVHGPVTHGDGRGRTLGFPTANVDHRATLLPPPGVYVVDWHDPQGARRAVANLGARPTFDGEGSRLEVHLPGFSGDLYGVEAEVRFLARLRPERRFPDLSALTEAIARDTAAAVAWRAS